MVLGPSSTYNTERNRVFVEKAQEQESAGRPILVDPRSTPYCALRTILAISPY